MNKKLLSVFALLLFVFSLVGCSPDEQNDGPVDDKYMSYYNAINADIEDDLVDGKITKRIELPTEMEFSDGKYGYITWTSSNEEILSNEGRFRLNTLDTEVTLHCMVNVEEESFEFDKVVLVKGYISKEAYLEEIYKLIPDNIQTDIVFPDYEDKVLAARGLTAKITCKSMAEDILSSKGEYKTISTEDQMISIQVTVVTKEFEIEGICTKKVLGRHDQEHVEKAIAWLSENFESNMNATGDLDLPYTDDEGIVSFIYESDNKEIFNNYGEMINFIADTEVTFRVTAKMNDYTQNTEVKAKTIDRSQMIEYIMDRMHKDTFQQIYLTTFVTNSTNGTNFDDFGFLNFYTKDISEKDLILSGKDESKYIYGTKDYNSNVNYKKVSSGIVPWESVNRPKMDKTSIDFICIHDTGDNKYDALGWTGQITTDSREVSWHFTVDDHDIYQHIPLQEVAWHAGDGSNKFGLIDTGIKYAGKNPDLEFKKDGYLYINGIKSKLRMPSEAQNNNCYAITPAGLYTEMGDNGNYYINGYHYSGGGYNKICTNGGNRNSIGIETCILDNTRYSETMRSCANLVAHLLKMYNLDISRVQQHRNFSGKLCPQSMIRMGVYEEFIEWVFCELYILNNLNGAKFTYTSNNPELVDNNGLIQKYVTKNEVVSYTVKVEYEDLVFEKTYETTILPLVG